MSLIPKDLYRRGKSLFTMERFTDALSTGAYSDVIATDAGKEAYSGDKQILVYKNTVVSGGNYTGGFTTNGIVMGGATGVAYAQNAYAAELVLNGFDPKGAPIVIAFTDGTNTISITSSSAAFNADTTYTGTVNGASVSGTLSTSYNLRGDYNSSRSTSGKRVLTCQTFRVDVGRGEISLWTGDQVVGIAAVAGLTAFGKAHFQLAFQGTASGGYEVCVKQIGLRAEC